MKLPPSILALSLLSALACGDDSPASDPDAGPATDGDAGDPDADIAAGDVPRVEPAACRFSVPPALGTEGSDYECGDLVTLEDRAAPDGRVLRLHYIQIHGADSDVATIYLDGGPGGDGSGILYYFALDSDVILPAFLTRGDVLVLAQRGTGLSQPSLQCSRGESAATCAARLSETADLSAFTTAANADDVDELRGALGYEMLDVYGISYGSRLTLEVLRRHGDRVRAAVAGGTVPAQIVWPAEIPASFHGALTALRDSCAADAGCDAAYGDLAATFAGGLTALAAEPAVFAYRGVDVPIDDATYASLLFQLLYSRSSYPMLPLLISDLAERRTDRVADYLTSIFDAFGSGGGVSQGMYLSIVCGELFNPPDQSAFDAANAEVPALIREAFEGSWYGLIDTCGGWPIGAPLPQLSEAVRSEVPTLVPNGRLDPITPPRFGDAAAATLPGAEVVAFASSGHGSTLQSACGNQVLLDFFADPAAELDVSCAAEVGTDYVLPRAARSARLDRMRLRAELAMAPVPPPVREPIERALDRARKAPVGAPSE